MQKPDCSVIIPVYNGEKYIEECLRSVQTQTLRALEILVIDDASTDRTCELVEALRDTDDRIRLVRNERNLGVAETRNRGVRQANAEWIAFLDSDDVWLPDKLEKQFALQRVTKASFVYSGAVCMSSGGALLERCFTPPVTLSFRQLLRGNEIVCSSVLIQRGLLLTHPMTRSELHEDFICWLQILADGVTAYGLSEPLLCYRLAEQSKSSNKLKSARMTWQSYAHLGIPFLARCTCFIGYALHGVKRYLF